MSALLHLDEATSTAALCAWCAGSVELTEFYHAMGFATTHGICPACKARVLAESEQRNQRRDCEQVHDCNQNHPAAALRLP